MGASQSKKKRAQNASSPASSSPASSALEERLRRFYRHYAPHKLDNVPHIAAQYGHDEAMLFGHLVSKYGPEPTHQQQQQDVPVLGVAVAQDNTTTATAFSNNNTSFASSSSSGNSSFGYNASNNGSLFALPPGVGYPEDQIQQHQQRGGGPLTTTPKYILDSEGVRRLNPEFVRASGGPRQLFPLSQFDTRSSLPVVSTLREARSLPATSNDNSVLAASTTATLEMVRERDVHGAVGFSSASQMVEQLESLLSRFEVPLGLVNKLFALSDYELLEVLVDDSGSMRLPSTHTTCNARRSSDVGMTRWQEVKERLFVMCELLVHVPCPPINIFFMNAGYQCQLDMSSSSSSALSHPATPSARLLRVRETIERLFTETQPSGTTPAYAFLAASLARNGRTRCVTYFFGDGQPNGGAAEAKQISRMLAHRRDPQHSPFTFLSCTDDDSATVWMKECEEVAPFCAEYDDYVTECGEVLLDQGRALPYTYGVFLISQLVGAMNPDDLDAMDESIPLTKKTLENLQGYTLSDREYRYYFGCFMEAQRNRKVETAADRVKQQRSWGLHYSTFLRGDKAEMASLTKGLRAELEATIL